MKTKLFIWMVKGVITHGTYGVVSLQNEGEYMDYEINIKDRVMNGGPEKTWPYEIVLKELNDYKNGYK